MPFDKEEKGKKAIRQKQWENESKGRDSLRISLKVGNMRQGQRSRGEKSIITRMQYRTKQNTIYDGESENVYVGKSAEMKNGSCTCFKGKKKNQRQLEMLKL